MQVAATHDSNILGDANTRLQNALDRPDRYGIVVAEDAIRWRFELEKVLHGSEALGAAIDVDFDSIHRVFGALFDVVSLKCLAIAFFAQPITRTGDMSDTPATNVNEVLRCEVSHGSVVDADKVRLQACHRSVNEHEGDVLLFDLQEGLISFGDRSDDEPIQLTPQ